MASKFASEVDEDKDDYWMSTQITSDIFSEKDVEDEWVEFGFKSSRSSQNRASSLANTLRNNIDWSSDVSSNELVEDKDDTIKWDGTAVKYSATSSGQSTPQETRERPLNTTVRSSPSRLSDHVSAAAATAGVSAQPTTHDTGKLHAEIRMLKRQLQGIKVRSVQDTVNAMLVGKPFYLEQYKSIQSKYELLDEAISCHDGNVITAVILFVKSTLKSSLFTSALMSRPAAVTHYLHYLKLHHDYSDYTDILRLSGRYTEAALFDYTRAISVTDPTTRINRLKACHRAHFQHDPQLSFESKLVSQHITLLELQQPIESADAAVEKAGQSAVFKKYPRNSSVINMPTVTTLYYCCFYHYELKENSFASPSNIKQTFSLSDKQYVWTACNALARLKCWTALEQLFITKGMFGRRGMKSPIGFVNVVNILSKNEAPVEVLCTYLRLIDNMDTRLSLANANQCHQVVVECLMTARDRQQLTAYRNKLTPHTKSWQHADDALSISSIKWKN